MTALSLLDNAVLLSSDSDAAAPRQTHEINAVRRSQKIASSRMRRGLPPLRRPGLHQPRTRHP